MTHHLFKVSLKAAAGTDWDAFQEQLDTAHDEVRATAVFGGRHGVLVTRHSHNAYTLTVSPEVPYGMTYERDDRNVRYHRSRAGSEPTPTEDRIQS